MSNEFYNFIAKNILHFFQTRADEMQPGERYCLKLDTQEMVAGVDDELRKLTTSNNIQGVFNYGSVYSTYTIYLKPDLEVVVASKINGMTDDFLATIRNAEMTENHFPVLMITASAIDTITSGTGDLSTTGMPFNSAAIIEKIKSDINDAQLPLSDQILLKMELVRKQTDRFSDKSSLYEYAELLTVLGRGYVKEEDYSSFSLLYDPAVQPLQDPKKIKDRLDSNHQFFEEIDRVFKHGNIEDDLSSKFDKGFISHLKDCKKKSQPWYEGYTYDMVKSSYDRMQKKLDNPLQIENDDFSFYSGTPLEYSYPVDEKVFIRCDGETKAKRRIKNILLYNPDQRDTVTIQINTNISIKSSWIEPIGQFEFSVSGKIVNITLRPNGCTFAQLKINDTNNHITYTIRICVIDVPPEYLENLQTCYTFYIPKNVKNSVIKVSGIKNELVINPRRVNEDFENIAQGGIYECRFDHTLHLRLHEDDIDSDIGHLDCVIKCGTIQIPIQIQDEADKPTELTGISAFKLKFSERKSIEYRDGKIVSGTKEFFAKEQFRSVLELESRFVELGCLALKENLNGYSEVDLNIPDSVSTAYAALIDQYKKKRTVPSLCYYGEDEDILTAAQNYVETVKSELATIASGATLTAQQNDLLQVGCVIQTYDEHSIAMSPLQPLNIMYQLQLMQEEEVGDVRDNLVEKLSPLYLIPYIKDSNKVLYQAVERKNSVEWRYYAPISNRRYAGARSFVSKLVCEKIIQYRDHFSFLFEDLGNCQLCINLVNMGDCREVFQGILRFYDKCLRENADPDDLLTFEVNIYSDQECYNEFSLLADQVKLKAAIREFASVEDVSELALIASGKIKCYYRNPLDTEYQYAHLTFFEMASSEDTGASRMDSITTGISLAGLTSGMPSVLNADWYKTGFGMKYARSNDLTSLAARYNALFRVAFSGSSYEDSSCIFTEIEQGQEGQLGKIYKASNWVVFVAPKVDLTFFQKKSTADDNLMIIHYSDQYTSASGYDDITVTQKSQQYDDIISEQLQKKGISVNSDNINQIISLFNAVNGGWLLRLITAKKLAGAADSNFSREKMSILSAIKLCMAYYTHPDIVWVPISLEEMLRISGGAGLSQKDGMLSAKNLGFEQRATSDDILLVGIEGLKDQIKIYLHPIEVKIGQNPRSVLNKARDQALNTYRGLWNALWPIEGRDSLERKLSRNFFMQLIIVSCEKMKLYNIYPDEKWDDVLDKYREELLNENYEFSNRMDQYIGKGTVVSFCSDTLNKSGSIENDICLLGFPEQLGSSYMVLSASEIERQLNRDQTDLPVPLKALYTHVEQSDTAHEDISVPGNSVSPVRSVNSFTPVASQPLQKVAESDSSYNAGTDEVVSVQVNSEVVASNEASEDDVTTPIGMQIQFGTNTVTGQPLYWLPNDTNQVFHTNTGIIGTMGTGKTQFTKSLITQLYRDQDHNVGDEPLGILIFDYKGDYNESKEDFVKATNAKILKPYHLPFNPLALTKSKVFKPLLPIHTANAFKDTLSKVYNLGPKQQNTLFQCIIDAYQTEGIISGNPDTWDNTPPTFDMVYNIYSNDDDIKKTDSLAAAMDKLYQFQVFEGDPSQTVSLFDLLNGVIVVDLSGYDADIQSLIVAITLDLFYSNMQAAGSSKLNQQYRQLTKLILVDEADNFMSEGFPSLKKILKEGREFGVGTILSTQFLKHFGNGEDDYSKYVLTWVVHNVADLKNSDVEFVFKTESKSQEAQTLFKDIKGLKKHHSIVKIGNAKPEYIQDKAFWELYNELNL